MPNLKFYLTSLEPNMLQTIYSQSIGGYISTSFVYPEITLNSVVGLYDMSLVVSDWTQIAGDTYLNINSEIIRVSSVSSNNVIVLQRGVNGIVNMHLSGDQVKGCSSGNIFNDVFDSGFKQYRCIALKNIEDIDNPSNTGTAYDMKIFFAQNSRNSNSDVKIAVEIPKSNYLSDTSTSWTSMILVDTTLSDYDNPSLEPEGGYFKDAYLKILSGPNSGQNRIINTFDLSTGTFVFYDPLPVEYNSSIHSAAVTYIVEPAPAQRIKTGTTTPIVNTSAVTKWTTSYITNWTRANQYYPVSINVADQTGRDNFILNEIIYIWLERTISKGATVFDNNDIILGLTYSITG